MSPRHVEPIWIADDRNLQARVTAAELIVDAILLRAWPTQTL